MRNATLNFRSRQHLDTGIKLSPRIRELPVLLRYYSPIDSLKDGYEALLAKARVEENPKIEEWLPIPADEKP